MMLSIIGDDSVDVGEGDVDDSEGGVEDDERLILRVQFHVSTNQAGWVYPEVKYLAWVSRFIISWQDQRQHSNSYEVTRSKTTLKFIWNWKIKDNTQIHMKLKDQRQHSNSYEIKRSKTTLKSIWN